MSKELEALEEVKTYIEDNITTKYNHIEPEIKIIESALKRLETIENANPSEVLECLREIEYQTTDFDKVDRFLYYFPMLEQALIKAQEQEKVLKIVFEKRIDLESFYITFIEDDFDYSHYVRYNGTYGLKCLTQEEFELLKEVLGNDW